VNSGRLRSADELDAAIAAYEAGERMRGDPLWAGHAHARRLGGPGIRRGIRGGGGRPYDPSQELGGALWDIWAERSVTEAGTGVSSWIAQSKIVGPIDYVQGTDANRPSYLASWRNGLPAIDANGTTDRLSATIGADALLAASQPYTVLCYGEIDVLKSATSSLIDFGNGRAWLMFESGNAGNPIGIFDSVAYRSVGADPSTGPHLWEWSVPGGATGLTVYQDGVALGTTPDTVTLAGMGGASFLFSIDGGGGSFFDGKVARSLIFAGIFDAGARARTKAYGARWSLP
jgi:hypothetical protein